jgi:hypothetical protein
MEFVLRSFRNGYASEEEVERSDTRAYRPVSRRVFRRIAAQLCEKIFKFDEDASKIVIGG